jgi:hypothetical protein
MTKRLAVALAATVLATAAGAQDKAAAAGKDAPPMEVQRTGKGKAASKRVVELRAKVTAVDVANRTITLQGPKGRTETYAVSPAVKRLDEIQAGDNVVMRYEQGLILQAQQAGAQDAEPSATMSGERAPASEAPGGTSVAHTRATVKIVAVDKKTRVVVLEGPGGNLYKVKAGPDIKLDKVKPGTKLVADYKESLAVSIEKAKPKATTGDVRKPEK